MELREYIQHREITIEKAAGELGVSRGYLHEILAGRTVAGRKLAFKIIKWSQNIIKLQDLWKDVSN